MAICPPAGIGIRSPRPLFGDRWPGPVAPPSGTLLAAASTAGLVVAGAVPDGPPGIGWLVSAVAAVAAVLVVHGQAVRSDGPDRPRPIRADDVGWTVAALALAGVGAVRAAEWLAALCLLAACGAAGLALAGRSFQGVLGSLAGVAVAGLRAVPWVGRGLRGSELGPLLRVGLALLAGLGLLAIFVPLLTSADAAFAQIIDGLLPTVDGDSVSRWIVLFVATAVAVAGSGFLLLASPEPPPTRARPTRLRCLDWALPTGLLVGLFALFVGVQFVVLFGSAEHVLRTAGLTYAEYARSGFWQLLAVTVLALVVLAVGSRWAPARTTVERVVKRALLAALALLTLVIVASAISRMWLYQQAYGFTAPRLVVLTCELWLGAGFLIALVAVLRLRPAGLTRPMVATGLLALLGLAALNPDRFVAEHNVARWVETGRIDQYYLSTLSADAVPALRALPEPMRSCTLAPILSSLDHADDWRSANLARAAAASEPVPSAPIPTCANGAGDR
ncbi:MAG TPA: DUF4173 domain-containing protein [Pseudonocardia sp.]|nr:DUF4173 domain-containing protein [Pseudonocardia sp.]